MSNRISNAGNAAQNQPATADPLMKKLRDFVSQMRDWKHSVELSIDEALRLKLEHALFLMDELLVKDGANHGKFVIMYINKDVNSLKDKITEFLNNQKQEFFSNFLVSTYIYGKKQYGDDHASLRILITAENFPKSRIDIITEKMYYYKELGDNVYHMNYFNLPPDPYFYIRRYLLIYANFHLHIKSIIRFDNHKNKDDALLKMARAVAFTNGRAILYTTIYDPTLRRDFQAIIGVVRLDCDPSRQVIESYSMEPVQLIRVPINCDPNQEVYRTETVWEAIAKPTEKLLILNT